MNFTVIINMGTKRTDMNFTVIINMGTKRIDKVIQGFFYVGGAFASPPLILLFTHSPNPPLFPILVHLPP